MKYTPAPPWNESDMLKIFSQTIRQFDNLNVCISPFQPNFLQYYRLLEQLAAVNIGVVQRVKNQIRRSFGCKDIRLYEVKSEQSK